MELSRSLLIDNKYPSDNTFSERVLVRGVERTVCCVTLASIALTAIAYHGAALLIKALPATVNPIIGKMPASLAWNRVFADHLKPMGSAVKVAMMAPITAWKSQTAAESYLNAKRAVYPEKQHIAVVTDKKTPITLPTIPLGSLASEKPAAAVLEKPARTVCQTVTNYAEQHPYHLAAIGVGVVALAAGAICYLRSGYLTEDSGSTSPSELTLYISPKFRSLLGGLNIVNINDISDAARAELTTIGQQTCESIGGSYSFVDKPKHMSNVCTFKCENLKNTDQLNSIVNETTATDDLIKLWAQSFVNGLNFLADQCKAAAASSEGTVTMNHGFIIAHLTL